MLHGHENVTSNGESVGDNNSQWEIPAASGREAEFVSRDYSVKSSIREGIGNKNRLKLGAQDPNPCPAMILWIFWEANIITVSE